MKTMNPEKYVIKNGNTAVHFLQRLLYKDINKQRKDLRNLLQTNNGISEFTVINGMGICYVIPGKFCKGNRFSYDDRKVKSR